MTKSTDELHIYQRSIQQGERTSLSVLTQLIPPGSTILDLGCGTGALGQYLAHHQRCTSDGVTLNPSEARRASAYYRRVEIADLETVNLSMLFAGERYDVIVCADVLEHLRQPEHLLQACRELLAPGGRLLISVPNAGYAGLLLELMHGDFRYRTEGLLDRTHLRFFTRRSLERFLREQHWNLETLESIRRELSDSEFPIAPDALPPPVARYVLSRPDALTYQLVVLARPSPAIIAIESDAFAADTTPSQAVFTAQAYLGDAGQYTEDRKWVCDGVIGKPYQTLRFTLPASSDTAPCLRFDPADRPGFLRLHRIGLRDAQGQLCWEWNALTDNIQGLASQPHQQIGWQSPLPTAPGSALLLLSGEDPWFELPIAPQILHACLHKAGASLEAEVGWPMSADYLALTSVAQAQQARIAHSEQSLAHMQGQYIQVLDTLATAQAQLQQWAPAAHELAHLQAQHHALQEQCQTLQAHISSIENSTIFRATRPIVKAKIRLDRALGHRPPEQPPIVTPPQTTTPPPLEPTSLPTATDAPAVTLPQPSVGMPAPAVDIIIPVYKGLHDTQQCVYSVLASTCFTKSHLIVINDASPDPELTQWLRDLAENDPRLTLLENASNQGFVATANRGMALNPLHDVVLLNSDTEVAGDWLDRLRATAYSQSIAGTVTPLSNNATICSYPRFCENNPLPRGYGTAALDALCAQTNPRAAIDIPTGVGFCMYIRRDCLSQIGPFDVQSFGAGYGEENDFCQRAAQFGWTNLLALDTFVRHTGGVSFGSSKTPKEQAALQTLQRLHPGYEETIRTHLREDPARPYRRALDIARLRTDSRPRVLAVLHGIGGGTLRHAHELATTLESRFITLSLIPQADHYVQLRWMDPHEDFLENYHWPTQAAELLALLRDVGISHVHYHHLLGVHPQIMLIPQQLGVSYDFTAHDYYTACPQVALVNSVNGYCGEQGQAQCEACLSHRPAPTGESILDWRLRHSLFLNGAANVLAPSKDTARRLLHYFPSAHVHFAPHTDIDSGTAMPQPAPHAIAEHAHLRVLVIGAVNEVKGGDILEATAIEAASMDAPIEFHLMGYAHRTLATQPHASLSVHGPYQDNDLVRLLQRMKPDLVWFPAQWPETYSYTLSACLQAGIPIVAPSLGAFPERLSSRRWTWLMPWNTSPRAWLDFFLSLRAQHFQTGHEPPAAPTFPAAEEDALIRLWSYETDYLRHLDMKAPA